MTRSSISASVIRRKQITHIDKLLVQRVEHGRLLTVLSLRKRKKRNVFKRKEFCSSRRSKIWYSPANRAERIQRK